MNSRLIGVGASALALVAVLATIASGLAVSAVNSVSPEEPNLYHVGDTITYVETVTNTNDTASKVAVYFQYPDKSPTITLAPSSLWPAWESRQWTLPYVVTGEEPGTSTDTGWDIQSLLTTRGYTYDAEGKETSFYIGSAKNSTILKPAITVDKTVDFNGDGVYGDDETYYAGSTATWKVVVTNTGNCPLTVNLTDVIGYDFPDNIVLAKGATQTFYMTGTYSADFTNTVTATGVDLLGGEKGTVTDTDDAQVHVIDPELSIVTTVDYTDADSLFTDLETGYAGGTATWKVVVTNDGDSVLTDVVVRDGDGNIVGTIASLAPGETSAPIFYTSTITSDTTETASATATDQLGGTVGPVEDPASVDIINPEIEITTKVDFDGDGIYSDISETGDANDPASWLVSVTNTGDSVLTNVVVIDSYGHVYSVIPSLAPGETYTFEAYTTYPAGDYTNTASVTATDALGGTVSDSDPASVDVVPQVTVTKIANPTSVPETGADVTYTITITNDSAEFVTIDSVTDSMVEDVATKLSPALPTGLGIGETYTGTYTVWVSGTVSAPAQNTFTATVSDDDGNTDTGSDDATVEFIQVAPTLTVTKTANPTIVPETGGNVTYTFTVANTSAYSVMITSLSDSVFGPLAGDADCQIGTILPAGASAEFTATFWVDGDFGGPDHVNTFTAIVTDAHGIEVSASDDATVTFTDVLPAVTVTKTASPTSVPETGADVTYTITITNDSAEYVTITSITDSMVADVATKLSPALPAGLDAGATYTGTYTVFVSG
ncbi:MAG: hypothetical protein JXA36_00800, partial [Coriobacteriia bacterium]|nr:hypothetical protein [Coriobacteriia bacterium]